MTMLKILKYPDPKLRRVCAPVRPETNLEEVNQLIDKMFKAMNFFNGIGLAAPQVGVPMGIIIVDTGDGEPLSMLNPEIIKTEGETETEESCLSIPQVTGLVTRPSKIWVKYRDREWNERELVAEGLKARCIQHKVDHLAGVLYVDYLGRLKKKMINRRYKKLGWM